MCNTILGNSRHGHGYREVLHAVWSIAWELQAQFIQGWP